MRKEKSMSIDFEKDQREDLDGANDANKLSDQVVKLQGLEAELLVKEQELKARNEYLYIKISRWNFS